MYEFEQNKKNNLIFHGVLAEHPETSEGYDLQIHSGSVDIVVHMRMSTT
jgi:hypothetical protein